MRVLALASPALPFLDHLHPPVDVPDNRLRPHARGRHLSAPPPASDSIGDVMAKTHSMDFGATDCALPMLDAMDKEMPVDCFMVVVMVELALHRGRSPRSPTGRLA